MPDPTVVRQSVAVADPNNPANTFTPNFTKAQAITKSDSTVYNPPLQGLYIGGAGDVALLLSGDTVAVTFTAVPVGTQFRGYSIKKVMSTNTTATLGVGLN